MSAEQLSSERGQYGQRRCVSATAKTAAAMGLVIVGVVLAPVIAIVGGSILATAFGGRRDGGHR